VFRLNRGREFYSSLSICQAVFRRIFSFYSTTCAFCESFASHQREANSTAFQLAVNTSFSASFEFIRRSLATPKPNLAPPFHCIDSIWTEPPHPYLTF
ncbi:hypothetical protein ACPA5B_15950, partial [Pseudomonas solani]|uniref:hypothetical protein n=1 Tax=Pseudomonas solani TaxID=2731552 RepID=UPI003C2EE151